MLKVKDTLGAVVEGNKDAAKVTASIIAGDIVNKRITDFVIGKMPIKVKLIAGDFLDSDLGRAVVSNVAAGVIIHTMPTNDKAITAAECMIRSAQLTFANSFDLQGEIDKILDGISLPELGNTETTTEKE